MITINSTSPLMIGSIEDRVAPLNRGIASLTECRSHLENMVEGISGIRIRRVVGTVFQDLLRLLECLSIIEGHLRQVNSAEETLAFFQLIRDEARSLIEFIKTDALNCKEVSGQLADTLDGLAFALSHDLRRVFEGEYETDVESSAYVVLGRVHRAHDVLTNCLQQSTVSLALVYEPALSVTQLFNNAERRYRQSLKLCSDLECLRDLVQEFLEGRTTSGDLNAGLETFRRDSLEFLMYSDWPQFESFCERISVSGETSSSLGEVLHQFLCYLETLARQVKMRAVLADESNPTLNHLSHGTATYNNEALPLLQTNDAWGGSALPA
ncbi:MAG TPA: hypothetical protein VJU84_04640 [Pyrinomonadaceae bacterium]|nr:hypothetical protein [Pyrinomonadaceae bacterium]